MALVQNANLAYRLSNVPNRVDFAATQGQNGDKAANLALQGDKLAFSGPIGGPITWPPQLPIDPIEPIAPDQATQAKTKLKGIEDRCDKDISAIDKAIAERTKGESWWQQMNDPVLKKLRAAKAELQKVKQDCQKAEQDLDEGKAPPPWILDAQAGGPATSQMWRMPQGPDYSDAETQVNDILGRLGRAESLLGQAFQDTASPLDGGNGSDADQKLHNDIGQILGDVCQSQNDAQDAQQNIYNGEDGNTWGSPWLEKGLGQDPTFASLTKATAAA